MTFIPPVRAEWYRFARTPATLWLLTVPAVLGVVRILGASAVERMERLRQLAAAAPGAVAVESSGFGLLADGLRTGAAVLTLLLLILGAAQMVRDRESGALALSFLARRRGAVVVGRCFWLVLFALGGFFLLFGACAAAAGALHGLGPVVDEGYVMATAGELWGETVRGALASLPAFLAAGLFGLFISSLSTTPATALAATLVPFVAFDILGGLSPAIARRVFVTYAPFLGDGSPLVHLTQIARAYSDAEWMAGELFRAVCVPGVEGLVLLLAAILATRIRSA